MFTDLTPTSWLTRAVSTVDAFAAPHGIDRYVEQVAPTWSSTEVRGRVVEVNRSSGTSVVLTIEANRNWRPHVAGQHTQLTVEIDGVRHTRCYSLSSAASTGRRFQLGIKAHPEGLVSQHLLANAHVGMVVGLSIPTGGFVLPEQRPERLLLVSGGSGITPVMSMLRTLCAEGHDRPVTFLHYAPSAETMLFRQELAELEAANPALTVLTVFDDGTGALEGLLDDAHLSAADPHWARADAFVCGPGPLMDAVRAHYEAAGALERFHHEAFTLPAFVSEAGHIGGTVRFGASDLEVPGDGQPLLNQAEDAGLAPAHGCRMGICHTCTRSLRCGTVRNATTGELTSGTDVDIRVCVSVAVGDVEIDL